MSTGSYPGIRTGIARKSDHGTSFASALGTSSGSQISLGSPAVVLAAVLGRARDYNASRWSASSWGADIKGEWSVSMEITFWHWTAVYICFCNQGVTPLSRRVSM